jgi:hypothetical protein
MGKKILAALLGTAAATAVIFAIESLSHRLYPPPAGLNVREPAALKAFIATLPIGAFLMVLLAYALGSLVGGMVATLIAGRGTSRPALFVGGLLMLFGVMDLVVIPHPLWFVIVSLLIYVPCAWLGSRLVRAPEQA